MTKRKEKKNGQLRRRYCIAIQSNFMSVVKSIVRSTIYLYFPFIKKKEQSDSIMKGRIRMPFDAFIYPFFMSVHLSIYHSVHLCSLYKLVAMDRLCKSFPLLGRRTLL